MPSSSTLNGHRRRWRSEIENDKDGMGRILAAYKYDLFDVCLLCDTARIEMKLANVGATSSIPLHSIRFDSIVGCVRVCSYVSLHQTLSPCTASSSPLHYPIRIQFAKTKCRRNKRRRRRQKKNCSNRNSGVEGLQSNFWSTCYDNQHRRRQGRRRRRRRVKYLNYVLFGISAPFRFLSLSLTFVCLPIFSNLNAHTLTQCSVAKLSALLF